MVILKKKMMMIIVEMLNNKNLKRKSGKDQEVKILKLIMSQFFK